MECIMVPKLDGGSQPNSEESEHIDVWVEGRVEMMLPPFGGETLVAFPPKTSSLTPVPRVRIPIS